MRRKEGFMGILWNEDLEQRYSDYRHTKKAWELLHEEAGFEDLGFMPDEMVSDLDGQETHIHFHEESPSKAMSGVC